MAVMQIVGYKNSGKTTLICKLLEIFSAMNLRVAVIKHDVHGFEVDREHTDTFRHRQSGAIATAITSPWRTAIIEEQETRLADLIQHFDHYDMTIIEGFKKESYPKIVMIRNKEDLALLQDLTEIRAVVVRQEAEECLNHEGMVAALADSSLPCYKADEAEEIAKLIVLSILSQEN
ncbi:molybdopterin-guanine dinucleotide biosynthesis protein B [Paenibacillus lentus]|uniref:Molybdopterin-guanine dinucleotide biosynthesis protein B n=1 Tax=Paenibacillus lentus TaxID=1338368 RepID=A0A3Q8SCA5_9BACL|nr:molybdopterin-guanine dinucleotide biosynthesis protein B [Paenibacillus lentus]AZK47424.1 molybdopterin-guanine dinucleotide biosynthesis protein B [Paenibacillus lentus]